MTGAGFFYNFWLTFIILNIIHLLLKTVILHLSDKVSYHINNISVNIYILENFESPKLYSKPLQNEPKDCMKILLD